VTDAFTLGFGYTLLETQYKDFTNFVNSAVGVSLGGICELPCSMETPAVM
jgi:hypothetical protein